MVSASELNFYSPPFLFKMERAFFLMSCFRAEISYSLFCEGTLLTGCTCCFSLVFGIVCCRFSFALSYRLRFLPLPLAYVQAMASFVGLPSSTGGLSDYTLTIKVCTSTRFLISTTFTIFRNLPCVGVRTQMGIFCADLTIFLRIYRFLRLPAGGWIV